MRTTMSSLVLVGYGLISLTVMGLGIVLYRGQSKQVALLIESTTPAVTSRPVVPANSSRFKARRLRMDIEQQRDRVQELQKLLNERELVLKQQASTIESRSAESRRLQADADRYFSLLVELLDESAQSINGNLLSLADEDLGVAEVDGADNDLSENEIDSLPDAEVNPDSLAAALDVAAWEIQQLRLVEENGKVESAELAKSNQLLQNAIVNSGEAAVPILINLLAEDDSAMRVWAARALGEVGMNSLDAMNALEIARDDSAVEVRFAATAALQRLRNDR